MISMYKSFMTRIADLIRRVETLERYNQGKIIKFGKITINAEIGTITVNDDNNNQIIEIGEDGIDIIKPGATTGFQTYLRYQDASDDLGKISVNRYISGIKEISDVQNRVIKSDSDDTITFNTMRVDNEIGQRKVFLQIDYNEDAGAFTSSAMTFGLDGQSASLIVFCDASDGTGYMKIPRRASDPPSPDPGYMYYNTTTNKFRGYNGSWHNFH